MANGEIKTQVIVLGAFESGTASVVRLIVSMGAWAGRREHLQHGPNAGEARWQHAGVRRLNDRLLEATGRTWMDLGKPALDQIPKPQLRKFTDEAKQLISEFNAHATWVVGDPRMCLLFEFWRPLLNEPICVLTHRPPATVAKLISLRHGLPINHCLALWEQQTLAALESSAGLRRTVTAHEQLIGDRFRGAMEIHWQLIELGAEDLRPIPASAFGPLANLESKDLLLSPEQSALARYLEDASKPQGEAPQPSTTPVATTSDSIDQSAGSPAPYRQQRNTDEMTLQIQLLRRNEELQVLRREFAELHRRDSETSSTDSANRSRGVFIIGSPRSGTSVFAWALAQHPNFQTSAESDFLLSLFGNGQLNTVYQQALSRSDTGWLERQRVDFPEFAAHLGLGVENLFDSRAEGARWIDATPGHTLMVDELLQLFPAASFLHIVRDGRAVVNSMISSGFEIEWASDFDAACHAWAHYALLGHQAARAHPRRVLEVRHETLVTNPGFELRRVFEFLGERPYQRSVNLITRDRINSSYGNSRPEDIKLPKNPDSAPKRPWESWNKAQRRAFSVIADKAMSQLGY